MAITGSAAAVSPILAWKRGCDCGPIGGTSFVTTFAPRGTSRLILGFNAYNVPRSRTMQWEPLRTSRFILGFNAYNVARSRTMQWRPIMAASVGNDNPGGKGNIAVLLEVDGPVADVHRYGHRQSFNVAFQKLGLDCANWSEPVYLDLLRQAGGEEETMLRAFFDRIGWPMSLPTDEKDAFVCKLMQSKQNELESLAASDGLPLRPDFTVFVDEAIKEHVPLIFLVTYNKSGERVSRLLVDKLGSDRLGSIKVIGREEVESSVYGQVVLGGGVSSAPDELLALEAAKAVATEKQRLAEEVASTLKLKVDINTTPSAQLKRIITALRAGAENAGIAVERCILLAGGQLGSEAANRIGMPCIVVRSSLTARAEFPLARAALDGFGAGAITIDRLRKYLTSS